MGRVLPPPPSDPEGFERYRKGKGRAIPSYDAALAKRGVTKNVSQDTIRWHTDPNGAMAERGKQIGRQAKRNALTSPSGRNSDGKPTGSLVANDDDGGREAALSLAREVVKLLRKAPESALGSAHEARQDALPMACRVVSLTA